MNDEYVEDESYVLTIDGVIMYLLLKYENDEPVNPIVVLKMLSQLMPTEDFEAAVNKLLDVSDEGRSIILAFGDYYTQEFEEFQQFTDVVGDLWNEFD